MANDFRIHGTDDTKKEYAILVDGSVEKHDRDDASINAGDQIRSLGDLTLVSGVVVAGTDGFDIEGTLVSAYFDAELTVTVDGEPYDDTPSTDPNPDPDADADPEPAPEPSPTPDPDPEPEPAPPSDGGNSTSTEGVSRTELDAALEGLAPADHEHSLADIDSESADGGSVATATGSGATTWSTFTESGPSDDPSGTIDAENVVVARDAASIQPAIDRMAEKRAEGGIQGGYVQLLPKAYYPTDTLWLKKGVALRGSKGWPLSTSNNEKGSDGVFATTIRSSEMPTGSAYAFDADEGAHTVRHYNSAADFKDFRGQGGDVSEQWLRDHTHPHLPIVSNFSQPPLEYEFEDASQEAIDYWGEGISLQHLRLEADATRYWDPADEPDGSEEEYEATYFGVYDGFLFENAESLLVKNVEVDGFDGYTAFYSDIRRVISRGNHYQGTATDYHGSTLNIAHSNATTNRYLRGQWSLNVRGPTPTVKIDNHGIRTKFVNSGDIKNEITGDDCRFLGTEADYDAGRAPIVDPANKHDIVFQPDGRVTWTGYILQANEGASNTEPKVGYRMDNSKTRLNDMLIRSVDVGIGGVSQKESVVTNTDIDANSIGVETDKHQATWHDIYIEAPIGIEFNSRASGEGGWNHVRFACDTALSGSLGKEAATFDSPDFAGADRVFDDPSAFRGSIRLVTPIGYSNAATNQETFSPPTSPDSADAPSVAHGMDEAPVHVSVSPMNAAARGVSWSATADQLSFEFDPDHASPDSDPDPRLSWQAFGWSHPDVASNLL